MRIHFHYPKIIIVLGVSIILLCFMRYAYYETNRTIIANDISLASDSITNAIACFNQDYFYYISEDMLFKNGIALSKINKDARGVLSNGRNAYISFGERLYKINDVTGEREVFFDNIYPLVIDEHYIFALSSNNYDLLKINCINKSYENITLELFSSITESLVLLKEDSEGYKYVYLNDEKYDDYRTGITYIVNPDGKPLFIDKNQYCKYTSILYCDEETIAFSDAFSNNAINFFDIDSQKISQIIIPEDCKYTPGRIYSEEGYIYIAAEKYDSVKHTNRFHNGDLIYKIDVNNMFGEIVFKTDKHIVGFDNHIVWTYDGHNKLKKLDYINNKVISKNTIKHRFEGITFEAQCDYIYAYEESTDGIQFLAYFS